MTKISMSTTSIFRIRSRCISNETANVPTLHYRFQYTNQNFKSDSKSSDDENLLTIKNVSLPKLHTDQRKTFFKPQAPPRPYEIQKISSTKIYLLYSKTLWRACEWFSLPHFFVLFSNVVRLRRVSLWRWKFS